MNTVLEWGQAEPRAFESKNDTRGVKLFIYSYMYCTVDVYLCTSQSLSHAINYWFKITYLWIIVKNIFLLFKLSCQFGYHLEFSNFINFLWFKNQLTLRWFIQNGIWLPSGNLFKAILITEASWWSYFTRELLCNITYMQNICMQTTSCRCLHRRKISCCLSNHP